MYQVDFGGGGYSWCELPFLWTRTSIWRKWPVLALILFWPILAMNDLVKAVDVADEGQVIA